MLNLAPVERNGYRIGFPVAGRWREALNTDSAAYSGGDRGHGGAIETEPVPAGDEAQSALLTLPPLSADLFRRGEIMIQKPQPGAPTRLTSQAMAFVLAGGRGSRRPPKSHRPPRETRGALRRQLAHHRLSAVERL